MSDMQFEPLYFADKLKTINPLGTIGVVTLWSKVDYVLSVFSSAGIDLCPETSPICVAGTLFGQGFRQFLRNLLNNPQIDTLLVFGEDKSSSYELMCNFFNKGVEAFEADVHYISSNKNLHITPCRVIGTQYIMDDLVTRANFEVIPHIERFDGIEIADAHQVKHFLQSYQPRTVTSAVRKSIELPDVVVETFPSNIFSHSIIDKTPSDAWKRVVHSIFRFGRRVQLKDKERIELQNLKVVVEEPVFEDDEVIRSCGFDPAECIEYQKSILDPVLPKDQPYTYGNRIRKYYDLDCLERVVEILEVQPEDDNVDVNYDSRKAYISLWDTSADLGGESTPCLASLFFRKQNGKINLTANYRTHNAARAWLVNLYGLMAIQKHVVGKLNLAPGTITVISHSISLDPSYLENAKKIHDEVSNKNIFREDPNGYFVITVDDDQIVLHHLHDGISLGEYRSNKPGDIQYQLYRNCTISDINHAMYVGMQLEKAYMCIKNGVKYEQNDAPDFDSKAMLEENNSCQS